MTHSKCVLIRSDDAGLQQRPAMEHDLHGTDDHRRHAHYTFAGRSVLFFSRDQRRPASTGGADVS